MKKSIIFKKVVFITLTVAILTAVLCFQTGAAANDASSSQSVNKVIITDTDISSRPDAIAAAQGIIPPPPPEVAAAGGIATDGTVVNGNGYTTNGLGIGLISSWYAGLYYTGSELELFGFTTTNYRCDIIMTTLYLQWWNGYQWIDLNSYMNVKYYSTSCDIGVKSPCFSGNYYRVRGVHFADDGNTFEEYYYTNIDYVYIP